MTDEYEKNPGKYVVDRQKWLKDSSLMKKQDEFIEKYLKDNKLLDNQDLRARLDFIETETIPIDDKELKQRYKFNNQQITKFIGIMKHILNKNGDEIKQEAQKQQKETNEDIGKIYENVIVDLLKQKLPDFHIYQPTYKKAPYDFSFILRGKQIPVNIKAKQEDNKNEKTGAAFLYHTFIEDNDMDKFVLQHSKDKNEWKNFYSDGNPNYSDEEKLIEQAIQQDTYSQNPLSDYLWLIWDKKSQHGKIYRTRQAVQYVYLPNNKQYRISKTWNDLDKNLDGSHNYNIYNIKKNYLNAMLGKVISSDSSILNALDKIDNKISQSKKDKIAYSMLQNEEYKQQIAQAYLNRIMTDLMRYGQYKKYFVDINPQTYIDELDRQEKQQNQTKSGKKYSKLIKPPKNRQEIYERLQDDAQYSAQNGIYKVLQDLSNRDLSAHDKKRILNAMNALQESSSELSD